MASWAEVIALSGFHYSGVEKTIQFKAFKGNYFWSNGYAWGTVSIQDYSDRKKLEFSVLSGTVAIRKFSLRSYGSYEFKEEKILQPGDTLSFEVKRD